MRGIGRIEDVVLYLVPNAFDAHTGAGAEGAKSSESLRTSYQYVLQEQ